MFLLFYKALEESTSAFVVAWFTLMKDTQFLTERNFRPFPDHPDIAGAYKYAAALSSIVSLVALQYPRVEKFIQEEWATPVSSESSATPPANPGPPRGLDQVPDGSFYIKNPVGIKAITQCFVETAHNSTASVPGFCWCLILYDLLSFVNERRQEMDEMDRAGQESRNPRVEFFENALAELFDGATERGTKALGKATADNALETIILMIEPTGGQPVGPRFWVEAEEDGRRMKNVIADLLRRALHALPLSATVLGAVLLANEVQYKDLEGHQAFLREDSDTSDTITGWTGSPAVRFTKNEESRKFLRRAKNRFPYEPIIFLKVMKALATVNVGVTNYLMNMDTYTQILPQGFSDYDVDDEDSDVTRIQLTNDLVVFAPRRAGFFEEEYSSRGGIVIPAGTIGEMISTGGSRPVVAWQHEYNAFPVLGRVLEQALIGDGSNSGPSYAAVGELGSGEAVTEIIGLLTILIACGNGSTPGELSPARILEEASDLVGRSRDVVSIIFDLLEAGLQVVANSSSAGKSTDFIVAAIQFVDALVPALPGRVWPYLARSTIQERHGRGGAFYGILSAVEVVRGDYEFTINCLRLFEDLVEEAIKSSVVNMGGSRSLTVASMAAPPITRSGVSTAVQRDILSAWTRVVVDVFESYYAWKYINEEQKLEIGQRISRIFTRILSMVYGVDESSDLSSKITSVLAPSAEHIIMVFLSEGDTELPMEPIIRTIRVGLETPESSFHLRSLNSWVEHVVSVIKFAEVCVRTRGYLGLPPSQLEKQLYNLTAPLAKLYVIHDRYRAPVLGIFESLVAASGTTQSEPPSLLGHLGADCASHFTAVLGTLDKPFDDEHLEARIWGFVSAVLSTKQQGLSILLLRGETLWQGGLNGRDKGSKRSLISVALDSLSEIDKISSTKSLAMLEAVALAQNFLSLAMDDLGKHSKFLPAITRFVEAQTIEFLPADSKEILTEKAIRVAVAAHIAQLLAIHLHSRRPSSRDGTFFRQLIPKLKYYFDQAATISGYRASLHVNLRKNFEEKWPGLTLLKLRKTTLQRKSYGIDYFYDMSLAGKVLSFDPCWDSRADGYANEVEQANLNLSLVDSQVVLLRAWKLLSMELCDFVSANRELEQPLVDVVERCLQANIETGLPPPIFKTIVCERAEFAFVILRRLQQAMQGANGQFDRILELAWKAIYTSATEFRQALATADVGYYRSLIRIIYLVLHANASKPNQTTESAYMVLDILNLVVAKGFKELASATHTHSEAANPEDIALVTAILQASLKLPGISIIHDSLATHMAENGTIRAATTLYSWSERLAMESRTTTTTRAANANANDPIYGELSLLFLLELSTIPALANQLATEGILDQILTSSLTAHIARQSVNPAGSPRLYAIWTRALLPLSLNLLVHIGPRIAREVHAFLSFFAPQLRATITAWKARTVVTLAAVNEAVSIAMVLAVLGRIMGAGGGACLDGFDKAALVEEVEYLLSHKNYLKSLVAATNKEEEEMLRREEEADANGNGNGGGGSVEGGLVVKVTTGLGVLQGLLAEDEGED
ncbi:unnamed protein product [Tuber melanosporum]|uniref:(Perigord truffle) hypothetical protein n=1 Tax=Tuber melanosporum (strain Mel28) TaxID=656061 RepID=D5GHQ5_TUBMM|nr:uncharacterized protein GSTUM_00007994001 [Tuber melanosporum]CAZ84016.1 unnamed protein product [Tuber melanosporum]